MKKLGRSLFILAQHIPSIGYCQVKSAGDTVILIFSLQGLNFIAGILHLVIQDEQQATDLLVHLVRQRQGYYGLDMMGLRVDMAVLQKILR